MLRERVVHPRVKVTLLADLTLTTVSIVPFTLSIAIAATIDPYFAFPPGHLLETLSRLFPGFLTPSKLPWTGPSLLSWVKVIHVDPTRLASSRSPNDRYSLER